MSFFLFNFDKIFRDVNIFEAFCLIILGLIYNFLDFISNFIVSNFTLFICFCFFIYYIIRIELQIKNNSNLIYHLSDKIEKLKLNKNSDPHNLSK
jgi:hypothetical protein